MRSLCALGGRHCRFPEFASESLCPAGYDANAGKILKEPSSFRQIGIGSAVAAVFVSSDFVGPAQKQDVSVARSVLGAPWKAALQERAQARSHPELAHL